MSVIIADIVKIMEKIAPSALAEQWDNVGLQVGQNDWPVRNGFERLSRPMVVEGP